jgi:hypothetical protein
LVEIGSSRLKISSIKFSRLIPGGALRSSPGRKGCPRESGVARQFAFRLSLLVFAATTADGAVTGSDLAGGLTTGLLRMAVFYGLGLVCGGLATLLIDEQVAQDFERWNAAADAASASTT